MAAPERFAKRQIRLLHRGRRRTPIMNFAALRDRLLTGYDPDDRELPIHAIRGKRDSLPLLNGIEHNRVTHLEIVHGLSRAHSKGFDWTVSDRDPAAAQIHFLYYTRYQRIRGFIILRQKKAAGYSKQ